MSLKLLLCVSSFVGLSLSCLNRQSQRVYSSRLSGQHSALRNIRISGARSRDGTSPMVAWKIKFCRGLAGSHNPYIGLLGNSVNCKRVLRNQRRRKRKIKQPPPHRRPTLPEVSNYIEDNTYYEEPVYVDTSHEEPYYQPEHEQFFSEPQFQEEPTGYHQINSEEHFSPSSEKQNTEHQSQENKGTVYLTVPVTTASPDIVPEYKENSPNPSPTYSGWIASPSPTFNDWTTSPSPIYNEQTTSASPTLKSWTTAPPSPLITPALTKLWTTRSPDKLQTTSSYGKLWTTPTPRVDPGTNPGLWTTQAPVREVTKKSVMPPPSDPTQPLFGNLQVTSNPWPSQYSAELLDKVENKFEKRQPPTPSVTSFGSFVNLGNGDRIKKEIAPEQKPTKITQNYFTVDHMNHNPIDTLAFDFDNSQFQEERPKISFGEAQAAAISQGSHAHQSSLLGSGQVEEDFHFLPDPLAPGHPEGDGNHGWAPIEEWAGEQISSVETVGGQSLTSQVQGLSWEKRNEEWKKWNLPKNSQAAANDIHSWGDEPEYKSQTDLDWAKKESSEVSGETSYNRIPRKTITTIKTETHSPVVEVKNQVWGDKIDVKNVQEKDPVVKSLPRNNNLYNNPLSSYESGHIIDYSHLAGPTGPPGIAYFQSGPTGSPGLAFIQIGPTGSPGIAYVHTDQPRTAQQLNQAGAGLHHATPQVKQNPFLVSTTPPPSIHFKREIGKEDTWTYNPVTVRSAVKTYDPFANVIWDPSSPKTHIQPTTTPPSPNHPASPTGYSFFKGLGDKTSYDTFHFNS